MNARLYDPALGRFLSPDPYIQSPDFTQNFNRYSYVLNNPLKYTDPDGEFIGTVIAAWLLFSDAGYEMQKVISPIACHINIGFGSDQFFRGYEISYGVPKFFPISYRKHYGETYYWDYYDNSYQGKMIMEGAEWAVNGYIFGIPGSATYSGTTFTSGEISQTTNMITIGNPFINIKYENDHTFIIKELPGVPKGDGDRFRTAALQLNAGPFSVGVNLFTGEQSDDNIANRYFDTNTGHWTYKQDQGKDPNKYRLGLAYFGVGSFRVGIDSESIRDVIQNGIHRYTGDPYFLKLNNWFNFYWFWGSTGGSTLWY